jgi:hypothetical protein
MTSRLLTLATGLFLAALLAGAPGTATAQSVATLEPVADTTIFHDGTSAFDNTSDGSGPHVWTSRIVSGAYRRALLRFDLSAIPPGSVVRAARLTLHQSRSRTAHPVSVHRLLAAWGEGASNGGDAGLGAPAQPGDATWIRRIHPGVPWATPGGDFVPTPSALVVVPNVGGAVVEWPSTAAMVADVQAWVDAPSSNHGWILLGDEETDQSAKRFSSRNAPTASVRPRLVVEYGPPPMPGGADAEVPLPAWALAALGVLLCTGLARRRTRG